MISGNILGAINLIELIATKQPNKSLIASGFQNNDNSTPKSKIAGEFSTDGQDLVAVNQYDVFGTPVVEYTDFQRGQYNFTPIYINDGNDDYLLPNALIMLQGEKGIIETDVIDRGTVYEKISEKPYQISLLVAIQGNNKKWPAAEFKRMAELYRGGRIDGIGHETVIGGDLVTLKCALTNPFLQPENNFLITKFSLMDNGGAEDIEFVQIEGKGNVDFELIIN